MFWRTLLIARPTRNSATVPNAIAISVFADAPGDDHQNTHGEYAMLGHQTGAA
jgi:hypothetical protein